MKSLFSYILKDHMGLNMQWWCRYTQILTSRHYTHFAMRLCVAAKSRSEFPPGDREAHANIFCLAIMSKKLPPGKYLGARAPSSLASMYLNATILMHKQIYKNSLSRFEYFDKHTRGIRATGSRIQKRSSAKGANAISSFELFVSWCCE